MILTLIALVLLLIGIISGIICTVTSALYIKYDKLCENTCTECTEKVANCWNRDCDAKAAIRKKRNKYSDMFSLFTDEYAVGIIATACLILGILGTAVAGIGLIINTNPLTVEKDVAQLQMEREVLVYRLETQQELGNELLYNEILEFNKQIYRNNFYHNNPWTSWFVPKALTEIEMIDYTKRS